MGGMSDALPKAMTWSKTKTMFMFTLVLDVLRYGSLLLFLFASQIVGAYVSAKTGSETLGAIAQKTAGATEVLTGAGVGLFVLGAVLSVAVAFAGWLMVVGITVFMNARIVRYNIGKVWWALGLGLMFSLTAMMAFLYASQIRHERAQLKEWQRMKAAERRAQREQQQLAALEIQQEADYEAQRQAANDNAEDAENGNDEIPE